jgi:hypothetical protein
LKRRDSTGDSDGTPARMRQGSSASRESYDSGDSAKKTPGMFPQESPRSRSGESPRSKTAEVFSRVRQQEEDLGLHDSSSSKPLRLETLSGKETYQGPSTPLTSDKLSTVTNDVKSPVTPLTPSSPVARYVVNTERSVAKELFPAESPIAATKTAKVESPSELSPVVKALQMESPTKASPIAQTLELKSPTKELPVLPVTKAVVSPVVSPLVSAAAEASPDKHIVPADIVELSEKALEVAPTLSLTVPPTPPSLKE